MGLGNVKKQNQTKTLLYMLMIAGTVSVEFQCTFFLFGFTSVHPPHYKTNTNVYIRV